MLAMIAPRFGGPEVFEATDLPMPEPGPGEIRVKVMATSVNPLDAKLRAGKARFVPTLPLLVGYDVAGIVDAVGPGVRMFHPGEEVFYSPPANLPGASAEYHVVREDIVALKPPQLSFQEAAALPLAGCTAWDAMMTLGRIQPGQNVLVHAGAGGVGSLAIQIAKTAGATVLTTGRVESHAWLQTLGADIVLDYRHDDLAAIVQQETHGQGLDVLFDTVGGTTLADGIPLMKPHGRLVSIVNTTGDLNPAYLRNLSIHFLFMERAGSKMLILKSLSERNQIKPMIDKVFPLRQLADAHRYLEQGGRRGKIVITVAE